MCTAITYKTKDHYFGRNLDLEYRYRETVTITPRNYPLSFRLGETIKTHYAFIGMATVAKGYPLYYDATNEKGLSAAGLNFPGNAVYHCICPGKTNIASFELIPWVLSKYETVCQVRAALHSVSIVNIAFDEKFPTSPLHWIISDNTESITVEPLETGLRIFDNPVGVLTNNPPFDFHMYNLSNYLNLTREEPVNRFTNQVDLSPYSTGMGAMGLPGDLSSASRFVRASFTKLNSVSGSSENESISQFFHILGSAAQQHGCAKAGDRFEKTVYSSCCNTSKGIYYYTTYENSQITGVDMFREDLNECKLRTFPLVSSQQIRMEN